MVVLLVLVSMALGGETLRSSRAPDNAREGVPKGRGTHWPWRRGVRRALRGVVRRCCCEVGELGKEGKAKAAIAKRAWLGRDGFGKAQAIVALRRRQRRDGM